MKSGGKKRPPTRSNPIGGPKSRESSTDAFQRPQQASTSKRKGPLPDDLADAAEAALDDLVSRASPLPSSLLGRKTPVPPPLMPPDDDDELDEPRTTSRAESEVSMARMQILGEDDADDLDLGTASAPRYEPIALGKGRVSQVQPPGMTEQIPTIALSDPPGERSEPTSDERPSARMRAQPGPAFEEVTSRASPVPTTGGSSGSGGRASPLPTGLGGRASNAGSNAANNVGRAGRASPVPPSSSSTGGGSSGSGGRASPVPPSSSSTGGGSSGSGGRASPVPTGRASPLPANVIARPIAVTPTGPTGRASPVPASIVPGRSGTATPTVPTSTPPGRANLETPTRPSTTAPPGRTSLETPTRPSTTAPPGRTSLETPTRPSTTAPPGRTSLETPTRPSTTAPPGRTSLETPTVPTSTPPGRASLETPTVPTSTPSGRASLETPTVPSSTSTNLETPTSPTSTPLARIKLVTPTIPTAAPPGRAGTATPTIPVPAPRPGSVPPPLAPGEPPRNTTFAPDGEASDEAAIVDERILAELPPLRFAVYEDSAHLASAQGAIVAAGHVVALGASGRDGMGRVLAAVRSSTHALDAVIVALPSGEPIIDAALALAPRRPVIIAAMTAKSVDSVQKAIAAGADLVTTRPHDIERFAPLLLAAGRLEAERRARALARGNEQLLRAKLDELSDPEPRGLQTLDTFERTIDREIKRAKKFEYPLSVLLFAVEIPTPEPPPGILGILRARAGNALINSIRDIDSATRLDHERFLVLSPYTDLEDAMSLAKRIIAAVADGDPVVSSGRTFLPRVVGAVAGAKPGEPVTYTKLVKDATRALENARRDGAELAVQS